jgi:hypothetical protein
MKYLRKSKFVIQRPLKHTRNLMHVSNLSIESRETTKLTHTGFNQNSV